MKAVLIPVKDPSRGKTRLARLLSPEERRQLAWAMFEDVCRAVKPAAAPDRVVVVTSFAPAIELARSLEWEVIIEQSQLSESASVDRASRLLKARGFDLVMRLPADVPLVRTEDIDELLSVELRPPAALLVPSREGTGTNAIIRTPPDLFPSRFGPGSLALHTEEAARAGAECIIKHNPQIALDIDEPSDIEALMRSGHGTRAFDLLSRMNLKFEI
ncbi:MAG TPA: 2-phospho-L-lactate guanylyltransferase [Blastocatellia bacterium]|nr:2-phospho-L-lactate guanylyltransferase [Blastocatellia bacterium]